jgi:hypothetical protein
MCGMMRAQQRFQRAAVVGVVGVDRVVGDVRANEVVLLGVVLFRAIEARWRNVIHPQHFHPGVADVSGIRGASHRRPASLHRAAIARGEKLPLLQREVRQLIDTDEQELRALILVDVVFATAVVFE